MRASLQHLYFGREKRKEIDRERLFETDILVGNALVDKCAKNVMHS